MQPEMQRQNVISQKTALALRTAKETQSGPARRYVPLDPAQYCIFKDDEKGNNWECERCQRRIAKKLTHGNKPYVVCVKPPTGPAQDGHMLLAVKDFSGKTGVPVQRVHRTEPFIGVGFELKKIFKRIKIELPPHCVCNSRVSLLNEIGIDEAAKMRDKVLRWFEEDASKRALAYDDGKANKVFDIAIRRARKKALKYAAQNLEEDG